MYDADRAENRRQAGEVAAWLRAAAVDAYRANALALLGGLPGTDGPALRQAARAGQADFGLLCQVALRGGGERIAGSGLTVEEVYAWLAALGYDGTPRPVAFHCIEDGCHARAQIMIEQLLQLGVRQDQIRRVWAFSARAFSPQAARMLPVKEDGLPFLDYHGALVEFDYHVAPVVLTEQADGTSNWRALDPSLLDGPAPVDVWHQRTGTPLHLPLTSQTTELGVAPLHPSTGQPFPGSGYAPRPDPATMTVSRHADEEMDYRMSAEPSRNRPVRPLPHL